MSGGTLPATLAPAQVQWHSMQPTRTSIAHSLKAQTRTRGAQRFGFKFVWAPMQRADFDKLYSFLLSQRGQADTFTTTIPGRTAPRGTWLGSPVVVSTTHARAVVVGGMTASQVNAVKAGDLIKFAGHSKVYMVTADASSDGTGVANITFEPALLTTVAAFEAIASSNVPFTVRLAADNLDANFEIGGIYTGVEADMVESW